MSKKDYIRLFLNALGAMAMLVSLSFIFVYKDSASSLFHASTNSGGTSFKVAIVLWTIITALSISVLILSLTTSYYKVSILQSLLEFFLFIYLFIVIVVLKESVHEFIASVLIFDGFAAIFHLVSGMLKND